MGPEKAYLTLFAALVVIVVVALVAGEVSAALEGVDLQQQQ